VWRGMAAGLGCVAVAAAVGGARQAAAQEPVRIEGWEQAQRSFETWQRKILDERRQPTEELRRILHHKIEVPVPPPGGRDETPTIPLRFHSLFGPQIYPGMLPSVEVSIGPPRTALTFNAEAGVGKLMLLKHKIGVAYSGKENDLAFLDVFEAKARVEQADIEGEMGGEYQLFGHEAGA